ncbi:MAG: PDZ domain-containing protein [Acidobacteriota bacterium]
MLKRTDLSLVILLSLLMGGSANALAQSCQTAPKADKQGKAEKPEKIRKRGFFAGYLGDKKLGIVAEQYYSNSDDHKRGVVVHKVINGTPAERAGLKSGDRIVEIEGQSIESIQDLRRKLRELDYGKATSIRVVRDGVDQQLSFTLEKSPDPSRYYEQTRRAFERARGRMEDQQKAYKKWRLPSNYLNFYLLGDRGRLGISAQSLTEQLGRYFGVEKGRGILVTSVKQDSPAAKAGIKAGDCIIEVNGVAITNSQDLREQLRKIESGEVRITLVREREKLELRPILEPRDKSHHFAPEMAELEFDLSAMPEFPEVAAPNIVIPEFNFEPGESEFYDWEFDNDADDVEKQ